MIEDSILPSLNPLLKKKYIIPDETNQNGMSKYCMMFSTVYSEIIAPNPSASIGLVIFDPINVPRLRPVLPFNTPLSAVKSSGSAVLTPINTIPIKDSATPHIFAKCEAPIKTLSAAKIKIINPVTMISISLDMLFLFVLIFA